MLKMFAEGEKNKKPVRLVIFGLSHMNLEKLKEGKPIKFNGAEAGLEADIEFFIFAGKTEQEMQHDFLEFIGPETKVHIDPKLKS